MENKKKTKDCTSVIFLHVTIFILAVSYVASKAASMCMGKYGLFSMQCMACLGAYIILTAVYAVTWQYNLEKFDLSFLYTNRCFYMIWSQIFAVKIFGDDLFVNNVAGLLLIFVGVWVNSKDVQ